MSVREQFKSIVLRSGEFSCPSCVAKIENKLNGLVGVESAEVKFASGRVLVDYDPAEVSVRDLVAAVAQVGYAVRPSAF